MEDLIVSMTTWKRRIGNLPIVLDSIWKQTIQPCRVVVNLSDEEFTNRVIPVEIQEYFDRHPKVFVNWVHKNTKVWKKFLPTFDLFPNAAIVCIDDDFIYPPDMLADFMEQHQLNPGHPISGNRVTLYGLQCHCGCASLVKREYFQDILPQITPALMENCPSSDFAYTYLLACAGVTYMRTQKLYFRNMQSFHSNDPYSTPEGKKGALQKTYEYLTGVQRKVTSPKVFYCVPWNSNKNIGVAYNEFAALCPKDSYICFMDADTMPTIPEYGLLIEQVLMRYPYVEAFTCKTNRVGCKWQIAEGVPWDNDDMQYHRRIGRELANRYGDECRDVTNEKPFSGLLLVIKKSAWDKINGACTTMGMLGVDNDLHYRIRSAGMRLYQMLGLYMYHWYRGGDKKDKSHLL